MKTHAKKKEKKEKGRRLNEDLCVERFEICVPKDCRLFGSWHREEDWRCYLQKLVDREIPKDEYPLESCCSCDCKPGWKLTGEWALKHAIKIHEKIHRQVLSLEQVSAVDVGFAVSERETRFWDFLAIRVHVNRKRSPEQLVRAGLANLTDASNAFRSRPGFEEAILAERDGRAQSPDGFPVAVSVLGLSAGSAHGVTHHEISDENQSADVSSSGRHDCECCRDDAQGESEGCDCCCDRERDRHLWRLIYRELGTKRGQRHKENLLSRYPVGGIQPEDLSVFCHRPIEETRSLEDVRLCVCGVPIDIINAQYNPSITHPGGDANSGVFADPPLRSNEHSDEEHLLIGRGRVNPLVGGVSVGSVTGQAGTLGTIVWDRSDSTPCVLSNWHVLAGTPTAQVGQPTYQPALFDGGTEQDVVANLKRWHLGEKGDAALAELAPTRHYATGEVLGLWHPLSGYVKPKLNLKIRKWGRTTGFTQGFIDGVHLATNIDYGDGVIRYFSNQFHIAPIFAGEDVSQTGDSGSIIVTSFSPQEQERDLQALLLWIIQFCKADSLPNLCKEINEDLCNLCEEFCYKCCLTPGKHEDGGSPSRSSDCGCKCPECTPTPAKDIYEVVCKVLKGLFKQIGPKCETSCAQELCKLLGAWKCESSHQEVEFEDSALEDSATNCVEEDCLRWLRIACKKIEKNLRSRMEAKVALEKLREDFAVGRLREAFVKKRLKDIMGCKDSCAGHRSNEHEKETCCQKRKRRDRNYDLGGCKCDCKDVDKLDEDGLCRFIEAIYECLKIEYRDLECCHALCNRLCLKIEKWHRQSCEIYTAQVWKKKLCEYLVCCEKSRKFDCSCEESGLDLKACCECCEPVKVGWKECKCLKKEVDPGSGVEIPVQSENKARSEELGLESEAVEGEASRPGELKGMADPNASVVLETKGDLVGNPDPATNPVPVTDPCPDPATDPGPANSAGANTESDDKPCCCGPGKGSCCGGTQKLDLLDLLACRNPSDVLDCIEEITGYRSPIAFISFECKGKAETNSSSGAENQGGSAGLENNSKLNDSDFEERVLGILKGYLENQGLRTDKNADDNFRELLIRSISDESVLESLIDRARDFHQRDQDDEARNANRAYYAVGMIFAGDTPGSPFGEFAVASDLEVLSRELRFSLRPVFEPRSSFRELRVRPDTQESNIRAFRSLRGLSPGGTPQGSGTGDGPQPQPLTAQPDPDNRQGGGGG